MVSALASVGPSKSWLALVLSDAGETASSISSLGGLVCEGGKGSVCQADFFIGVPNPLKMIIRIVFN